MAPPSLERLKALDNLEPLHTQLVEAKSLCTHSSRADMISRWLMMRLDVLPEARCEPEAWEVLSAAFRLQAPARVAMHIGSVDFLGCVQSALKEGSKSKNLVFAITACLNLLLQVARGTTGAPLGAALTVNGAKAASLLGEFLDYVYCSVEDGILDLAEVSDRGVMDPALTIWSSRKQSLQDNNSFAQDCLVPAALLYTRLAHGSVITSGKRKWKGSEAWPPSGYVLALESLLARHVFMPARVAFFERDTSTSSRTYISKDEQIELADRLSSLTRAISESGPQRPALCEPLPPLLDVALRCSPGLNPRQRLKERPWVEAIFAAFVDCLKTGGVKPDCKTLTDMLEIVKNHASLSVATLSFVAEHYATVGVGATAHVHWSLVAKVVELDANVYINIAAAVKLFDEISKSNLDLVHGIPDDTTISDLKRENTIRDQWKNGIILPIMSAFAKNRSLPAFVDLWHGQLFEEFSKTKGLISESCSLWTELDVSFAAILEHSLTESQIVELFRRYYKLLEAAVEHDQAAEGTEARFIRLAAAVAILNALFGGVKSEELCDKTSNLAEKIWKDLSQLMDRNAASPSEGFDVRDCPRLWGLLIQTLQRWYPSAVDVPIHGFLTALDSIADSAVKHLRQSPQSQRPFTTLRRQALEAQIFVGLTCCLLKGEPSFDRRRKELADELAELDARQAFVMFPALLASVSLAKIDSLFHHWIKATADDFNRGGDSHDESTLLRAVTLNATQCEPWNLPERVATVAQEHMLNNAGIATSPSNQHNAVSIVEELLVAPLSESTRCIIVSALETRDDVVAKESEDDLQTRLGLLIAWLRSMRLTEGLRKSSVGIAQLNGPLSSLLRQWPKSTVYSSETLMLIEQLSGHCAKAMLSEAPHESRPSGLSEFIQILMKTLEKLDASDDVITSPQSLAAIKGALSTLKREGVKVRGTLHIGVDQRAELLTQTRRLFALVMDLPTPLDCMGLDVLLGTVSTLGGDVVSLESLMPPSRTFDDLFDVLRGESEDLISHRWQKDLLCRRFETLCLQSSPVGTRRTSTGEGVRLLALSLSPLQHEQILSSFACMVSNCDAIGRIDILRRLTPAAKGITPVSAGQMHLFRIVLSNFSKADLDGLDESAWTRHILANLICVSQSSQTLQVRRMAIDTIVLVLREKPFLISQYGVETIVSLADSMAKQAETPAALFSDICCITTTILQHHRSRLNDRLHILVALLQSLITRLFKPHKALSKATSNVPQLSAKHAHAIARILQLLCDPPVYPRRAQADTTADLVDQPRAARARVGQHMHLILHAFCEQILAGTLAEGAREQLTPGLWAVCEAIECWNEEGIKVLAAGMSSSERAVLRSVHEEWRHMGRWKGG